MMINKKLLDILVCPVCKEKIRLYKNKMVCIKCKEEYEIKEGIPIMLKPSYKK